MNKFNNHFNFKIKILNKTIGIYFIGKIKILKYLSNTTFLENKKDNKKPNYKIFITLRKGKYFFYCENNFAFVVKCKEIQQWEDLKFIIKSLLNLILIKNNVLFLHAASIKFKDRGYLFSGPSGVGKTTLIKKIRRSKKLSVLSDDTAIVAVKKKVLLLPSIFDMDKVTEDNNNKKTKLYRVFFLNKSTKNKIIKLSKKRGIKKLYENLIIYDYYKKMEEIYNLKIRKTTIQNYIFNILNFLKKEVDFAELYLRKDINLNLIKKFLSL